MNDLVVKNVPFLGTVLLAAQDADGNIFAGVSCICNGIGLSKSQKDTQIQNVQHDEVLKQGCLKFQAGVLDPNNPTVALKSDYVPLWLAKISITPSMKEKNPEVAETLMQYQLRAKDVLAEAFIGKNKRSKPAPTAMTDYQRAMAETRMQNIRIRKAQLLERMAEDYEGTYRQVLQAHATKELTGEFLLPLPEIGERTYTATEIAEMLGCSAHKVGQIANRYNLKTEKYGGWYNDKAKNSNKEVPTFRYFRRVVPVMLEIIEREQAG